MFYINCFHFLLMLVDLECFLLAATFFDISYNHRRQLSNIFTFIITVQVYVKNLSYSVYYKHILKDSRVRLCVDYRKLNQIIKFNAYLMPQIKGVIGQDWKC